MGVPRWPQIGLGPSIGPADKVYCITKIALQALKFFLEGFSTNSGVDIFSLRNFLFKFSASQSKRLATPVLRRGWRGSNIIQIT